MSVYFDQFQVTLDISVRMTGIADLQNLEWFGMYSAHREIIMSAFKRHQEGENIMLIADLHGLPAGQIWIDLTKRRDESIGVIWALRVFPLLQNQGIGTRLLRAAEALLRENSIHWAEVGVEIHNIEAKRLYNRLGYREMQRVMEEYSIVTAEGMSVAVPVDQWLMRKELNGRTIIQEDVQEDPTGP